LIGHRRLFGVDGDCLLPASIGTVLHCPDCNVEYSVKRDAIGAHVVGMRSSGKNASIDPKACLLFIIVLSIFDFLCVRRSSALH
jgi:hypothetical protein